MNLENHKILMEWIRRNRFIRRKLARLSHSMFFVIYFNKHMTKKMAPFQREIFKLTEKKSLKMCVISAFRGSSKSTICSMSFPIWAVVTGQAHYVMLASQTQKQARQQLKNIRDEFESNALLRNDFGPFEPESDQWGAFALVFKNYDAKIQAVSVEEAIRGYRYKQYRPDLIILDDIENLDSTRTRESRNKVFSWFTSEIVPLGTTETRIMILGNFLHDLSLVGRVIAQMQMGSRDGEWRRFPLINDDGSIAWPGMFPTMKDVEAYRRTFGDDVAWKREIMLEIIPDDWQIIHPEWIQFYDALPEDKEPHTIFISADLAISEKESADYTAIVTAYIYNYSKGIKVYLIRDPINKRMNHPDTLETLGRLYRQHYEICSNTQILIEDVAYQKAVIQDLTQEGYVVKGIPIHADKRSRLMTVSNFFKGGVVLLPKRDGGHLYDQLIGFGNERYDDLVDATTMILTSLINERPGLASIKWVGWPAGPAGFTPLVDWSPRMNSSLHQAAEKIIFRYTAPEPKNEHNSFGSIPNSLTALNPNQDSSSESDFSSRRDSSGRNSSGSSGHSSGGSSSGRNRPSGNRSSGSGDFISRFRSGGFLH